MDNFVLSKALLTETEQQEILAALQSLNETPDMKADKVVQKLKSLFGIDIASWVSIDYSDWSNYRQELFLTIKNSILQSRILTFDYYNSQGSMKVRKVEPLQLYFKSLNWYLKAYCMDKKAVRLFKLTRMNNVVCEKEHFAKRKEESPNTSVPQMEPEIQPVTQEAIRLKVDKDMGYRVYDFFDVKCITVDEEGNFLISTGDAVSEWLIQLVLSFGKSAMVIYPESFKETIKERFRQAYEKYK